METSAGSVVATSTHAHDASTRTPAQSSDTPVTASVEAPDHRASRTNSYKHTVELPLGECLMQSLDVFNHCMTKWGLVTDVRADGSTYKRHGVIVQLSVDMQCIANPGCVGRFDWTCGRIRQAIDLAKLALAVDPHALMPLLVRPSLGVGDPRTKTGLHAEELASITRGGAPFELQLSLSICTARVDSVNWSLVKRFMRAMDEEDMNARVASPTGLHKYLVEKARATPWARRLIDLPVPSVIHLSLHSGSGADYIMDSIETKKLFENWAATAEALHEYQEGRVNQWDLENKFAPLTIKRISLELSAVPLAHDVVTAILAMASQGIPVSTSCIGLDIRYFTCGEDLLRTLLETLNHDDEGPLTINTGPTGYQLMTVVDIYDDDYSASIRSLLRCVGSLDRDVEIDLGNMLQAFELRDNQQAFTRALFEFVFTRNRATSVIFYETETTQNDADLLEQEARRWRQEHPDRKLRLRSLVWSPDAHGIAFIKALLRALDDVEKIDLYPEDGVLDAEDVHTVLRYPSLRRLYMGPVNVPTMEVFDTSTDGELKPKLERLQLSGLTLGDPKSMVPFIKRLDLKGDQPSALSRTLRTFGIAETHESVLAADRGDNYIRRAINDAAAVPAMEAVLSTNRVLQNVNFFGNFANFPVRLSIEKVPESLKAGHIPAPVRAHERDLLKARNAAFVSAVRDGDSIAMHEFDSNLVRTILSFSTPHTYRKIRM